MKIYQQHFDIEIQGDMGTIFAQMDLIVNAMSACRMSIFHDWGGQPALRVPPVAGPRRAQCGPMWMLIWVVPWLGVSLRLGFRSAACRSAWFVG